VNLAIDHASIPREGESVSGDAVLVRREEGVTLLAVVDALGHGTHAAAVATRAIAMLEGALRDGAVATMQALHEELRPTRGAAALLCFVRDTSIEGCGVGNVEMMVRGAHIPVILTSGIIGRATPRFRRFHGELRPGCRLAVLTDGISSRLSLDAVATLAPGAACRAILETHRRAYDDATVLIADAGAGDP
jgi:phosphoserine phosphatase RsbX